MFPVLYFLMLANDASTQARVATMNEAGVGKNVELSLGGGTGGGRCLDDILTAALSTFEARRM